MRKKNNLQSRIAIDYDRETMKGFCIKEINIFFKFYRDNY